MSPHDYRGLSQISLGYTRVRGRLPMCYAPVCRGSTIFTIMINHENGAAPRLACLKHAASVHPEPGSNSQLR